MNKKQKSGFFVKQKVIVDLILGWVNTNTTKFSKSESDGGVSFCSIPAGEMTSLTISLWNPTSVMLCDNECD